MSLETPVLHPSQPRAVRLMNTIWFDRTRTRDSLESLHHLQSWVELAGLGEHSPLDQRDLDRARALRDALRRLAADVTGDDRPEAVAWSLSKEAARAVLNDLMATCTPVLRQERDGYARGWRSSASGFQYELALVALEGAELLTRTGPDELKACPGPGCVLYFVRNHPRREWCSAACGNRGRVARHYRRKRS